MPDDFIPSRPGADDLIHESEWRQCACSARIRVTSGLSLIEQFDGEDQVMWAVEKFHCYFCGSFGWLEIDNMQPARKFKIMIMTAEGLGQNQPSPGSPARTPRRGLRGLIARLLGLDQ